MRPRIGLYVVSSAWSMAGLAALSFIMTGTPTRQSHGGVGWGCLFLILRRYSAIVVVVGLSWPAHRLIRQRTAVQNRVT